MSREEVVSVGWVWGWPLATADEKVRRGIGNIGCVVLALGAVVVSLTASPIVSGGFGYVGCLSVSLL